MALSLFTGGYLISKETRVRNKLITSGDIFAVLEIIMSSNAEI